MKRKSLRNVFFEENIGVEKRLKPDVFQEFSLREKTVLSHNVAM